MCLSLTGTFCKHYYDHQLSAEAGEAQKLSDLNSQSEYMVDVNTRQPDSWGHVRDLFEAQSLRLFLKLKMHNHLP